jgi:deoxyribodipyrimidine photo-lyase
MFRGQAGHVIRVNPMRVRFLRDAPAKSGPIVYWMSRDQRVQDNWALLFAQEMALKNQEPLAVIFCLVPSFLNATLRHYSFMLTGLREMEDRLKQKNMPFFLLSGSPEDQVPAFAVRYSVGAIVTDFDPLRIKSAWKKSVARKIDVPLYEVDAHNIVPCWLASPKQEFAARTFRPKIQRLLGDFLDKFPKLQRHPFSWVRKNSTADWDRLRGSLHVDTAVSEVTWIKAGERAARRALRDFTDKKLAVYSETRNDPTLDGQSNLSPYLHFGQLSAQRVALEVQGSAAGGESRESYLEELIVRRELSDNFCFYNGKYDALEGFPAWAQRTLNEHSGDEREHEYELEKLENAETHDDLWNAAQMEMVQNGKMHGYLRMYWAKKILEWSGSPEEGLQMAIYLNDRYELDGRDPNGYVGCAWSIGGVHDRAWFERPIFGKVRYMSYNGCKSKFNVDRYIEKVKNL